MNTSDEGAGTARRRSTRLRSQIHTSEEVVGVTRRRSTRFRSQFHSSADGAGVTRRCRCRGSGGTSPAAGASLPDEEDILWEILLRLPPQPSSLPRASAVCRRWRCIVGDPKFRRQFYAHHRKPPLLGVFSRSYNGRGGIVFRPILDPPDRIPPMRFGGDDYDLLGCHHGLVLIKNSTRREVIVHDPVTGEQRRLAVPPEFHRHLFNGAVLCSSGDQGHVHGGCHSSPFKRLRVRLLEDVRSYLIIQAEHGAFGYAILSYSSFQMWQRDANGHGIATWVPWKTIEMHSILKLPPQSEESITFLLGYDEDTDAIFLSVNHNIYMVQLKSMQSKKLFRALDIYRCHPFKSFYTPAIRDCDEAVMLHDP